MLTAVNIRRESHMSTANERELTRITDPNQRGNSVGGLPLEAPNGPVKRHDFRDCSGDVLAAAFAVSNSLGCGFLEKVYENALALELEARELRVVQQAPVDVKFRERVVGRYFADLLVEGSLVVEVKSVREFDPAHEAQCINYLRASGLGVCLLLNFAKPRLAFRRIVLRQEGAANERE